MIQHTSPLSKNFVQSNLVIWMSKIRVNNSVNQIDRPFPQEMSTKWPVETIVGNFFGQNDMESCRDMKTWILGREYNRPILR